MQNKIVVRVYDHLVTVLTPEAELTVYPDGRASLARYGSTLGSYIWAGAGRFDWHRFRCEDLPSITGDEWEDEAIYSDLETALEFWAETDEGQDWLRSHKLTI
jgi:hypothetical protein